VFNRSVEFYEIKQNIIGEFGIINRQLQEKRNFTILGWYSNLS